MAERARLWREPHVWVFSAAAVAAAALLGTHLLAAIPSTPHGLHDHGGHGPLGPPRPAGVWAAWTWWLLMVSATMLPVAARAAGRVARGSLWRRRHRAMLEYLLGYLVVWALCGLALVGLVAALRPGGPAPWVQPVVLATAAGWHTTSVRCRVLRRCGATGFVAVHTWRADRDCVAAGLTYGRRCVLTCGPAMAAMAFDHGLTVMVVVTAVLWRERAPGPNPDQRVGRRGQAYSLAALAAVAALWALLTGTGLP